MSVTPFSVHVDEEVLGDLRERLRRMRWPDAIPNSDWRYGTSLSYLKELVSHWLNYYDWRAAENEINSFSHFKAEIDGLKIHFLHERGRGPNPLPIILTHGWPSSFYEFTKIIHPLADPVSHGGDERDAFHVVVPSIPGYGFSDRPKEPGVDPIRIGELWFDLMTKVLDHQKFAAHGGDWGLDITTALGVLHPENLLGVHVDMAYDTFIFPPLEAMQMKRLTREERKDLQRLGEWQREEEAYSQLQATKPQTLSYALNDSPAGLAAWIVEKFRSWSDCAGNIEKRFSKDELLTNIMIYWVTETANSASRIYYEARRSRGLAGRRCEVPTCGAIFPREPWRLPRKWAERVYKIVRWTEMPAGGHFPAMEEPELLIQDIRDFFRRFRR